MTSDIAALKQGHKHRNDEIIRKRNENAFLTKQMKEQERRILDCADKLGIAKDATALLETIANSRRGSMKKKIEDVVSEALRLIYGPDYRVEMTYGMKNNRSSLDIEMVRTTPELGEVRREIGGFGGGMADTISVPLRLMVLLGSKQAARISVLDESWKHIDGVRIEAVAEFLKMLTDKLGMQIIIATHHEVIKEMADRVYTVSESGGKSTVRAT